MYYPAKEMHSPSKEKNTIPIQRKMFRDGLEYKMHRHKRSEKQYELVDLLFKKRHILSGSIVNMYNRHLLEKVESKVWEEKFEKSAIRVMSTPFAAKSI